MPKIYCLNTVEESKDLNSITTNGASNQVTTQQVYGNYFKSGTDLSSPGIQEVHNVVLNFLNARYKDGSTELDLRTCLLEAVVQLNLSAMDPNCDMRCVQLPPGAQMLAREWQKTFPTAAVLCEGKNIVALSPAYSALTITGPDFTKSIELSPPLLTRMLGEMPAVSRQEAHGTGSEYAPQQMSSIQQWADAAATEVMSWNIPYDSPAAANKNRGIYHINGQTFERSPEGAYSNYITAITDGGKALSYKTPVSQVTAFQRPRLLPSPDKNAGPIYRQKYLRLCEEENGAINDPQLARDARRILQGKKLECNSELPGLVTSLFLGEVSRSPQMLPIGLMLLDLIEKGVPGFTWENALSPLEGKLPNGGSAHPMVHNNAQKQAKEWNANPSIYNEVSRKATEIFAAWLNEYCKSSQSNWKTNAAYPDVNLQQHAKIAAQSAKASFLSLDPTNAKNKGIYTFYQTVVNPALQQRGSKLDCML